MAVYLKSLLLFFGLSGVGSAVGMPLAFNSERSNDWSHEISTEARYKLPLSKCLKNIQKFLNEINYGEENVKEVCWKLSDMENKEDISDSLGKSYESLFKATWGKTKNQWKGNSYGHWTQQCSSVAFPWVIVNEEEQVEYIGLCDNRNSEDSLFVKRSWEESAGNNKSTLLICDKNCWESPNETISGFKVLKQEKTGRWKPVQFYVEGDEGYAK